MKQETIVIFGGSGFVGKHIVHELAFLGYKIKIISRNPEKAKSIKLSGAVGQIVIEYGNIFDENSIRKAISGSDIVINLVGILFEKGRSNFTNIHSKLAENIAKISTEMSVKRLIQISALGVGNNSKSKYLRTKLNGEKAAVAAFPDTTIIRPSIIFGAEDNFFNKFAQMACWLPFLPLIGGKSKFQPIYVGDIAKIVAGAILDDYYKGRIIEAGGPDIYSFEELMKKVTEYTNRSKIILDIPDFIGNIIALFSNILPTPIITNDQISMLQTDNVVSRKSSIYDKINLKLNHIDFIVPKYLGIYKK